MQAREKNPTPPNTVNRWGFSLLGFGSRLGSFSDSEGTPIAFYFWQNNCKQLPRKEGGLQEELKLSDDEVVTVNTKFEIPDSCL